MSGLLGPAIVAFFVGAFFTGIELVTGKYWRTFFLVRKCKYLYWYAAIYGVFAAILVLVFHQVVAKFITSPDGSAVQNVWVQAVIVGICVKAFLHINLFNVPGTKQPTPIGLELIAHMFEPELLRSIGLAEWLLMSQYLQPRLAKYTDLAAAQSLAKANIPPSLPQEEKDAFAVDIDGAASVQRVMQLMLKFGGQSLFEYAFP